MTSANPEQLRIVVGVTGGIAAYKAVSVIRALVLSGHHVDVIATEAALQFVGAPTFEAISRNPLHTSLYDGVAEVRHVALGKQADVVAVVPATADCLARMASGMANDLLTNTLLATTAPVLVAPAMHTEMWQHPATVANVETLRARGVNVIGPESGQLTGSDQGPGRMSEPDDIAKAIVALAERDRTSQDLAGRRILITAGGTREPLDPVRYLGNRSSGKQGVALATRARDRGAAVTLIAANLEVEVPTGIECIRVGSAQEMARACLECANQHDVVIMAAAVADFRPAEHAAQKIKKEHTGEELTVRLVQNPDILRELVQARDAAGAAQCIVGFAAETEADEAARLQLARDKRERKGCDYLVCNLVGTQLGFGEDANTIDVIGRHGERVASASGAKMTVADTILDVVSAHR